MKTYFLKFADEAEAIMNLGQFRMDEEWLTSFEGQALDVVGTISKPTGVILTDSDGNKYPETLPIAGFHGNLASNNPLPAELTPFSQTPLTPSRVFAGVE